MRTATEPSLEQLQADFLAELPRIEAHALVYFRWIRCPGRRADAVAEVMALAWAWYCKLALRGKKPDEFVARLADFAVRHVRAGRRLCGREKVNDVLSPLAQQRRAFCVQGLPARVTSSPGNPMREALADNRQTPPDEQAAFRIDFPAWMASQDQRRRLIALDLMIGERTGDVAGKHGMTPGRVSQLRRELRLDWRRFHGEPAIV